MISPSSKSPRPFIQMDAPPTKETVLTPLSKNSMLSNLYFKEKAGQLKTLQQNTETRESRYTRNNGSSAINIGTGSVKDQTMAIPMHASLGTYLGTSFSSTLTMSSSLLNNSSGIQTSMPISSSIGASISSTLNSTSMKNPMNFRLKESETLTLETQISLARHSFVLFRTRKPDAKEDDDDISERLFFYLPSSDVGGKSASTVELHAVQNLATNIEGFLNVLNETYQSGTELPGSGGLTTRNHTFVVDSNHGARIGICKRDILIFVLCCKNIVPKSLIREHVAKLANFYELGNGPIADIFDKKCNRNDSLFEAYVKKTVPELRVIASQFILHPDRAFYPLSYCEFPPRTHSLLIGASQILESCTELENRGFLGGCIFRDQSIICNHLDYDLIPWVLHKNQVMKSNFFNYDNKMDQEFDSVNEMNEKDNDTFRNENDISIDGLNEYYIPPSPTDSINSGFDDDESIRDMPGIFQGDVNFLQEELMKEEDISQPLIEEVHPEDGSIAYQEKQILPQLTHDRIVEMLSRSYYIIPNNTETGIGTSQVDSSQKQDDCKPQIAQLGKDGSMFHASYIYLEKKMIEVLSQNIYSTYNLKKASFSAQDYRRNSHDSSRSSICSGDDAPEGVYVVLVVIVINRISIAAIYSKETVLAKNFIQDVVQPLQQKLAILENKHNLMKGILSQANENPGVKLQTKPGISSSNNLYLSGSASHSSLLYDRFSHQLTISTPHTSHIDPLTQSVIPVRGILYDDFSSKVILKKSDEILYGKVMFESEIYEKLKLDKMDIPIEKAEGLVRKHIHEEFKINII